MKNFYDFVLKNNEGFDTPFTQFQGKTVVIVNTASKCGYTSQYKDLQALYERYKARDFLVLAFPSNDFGGQEPGTDAEIRLFCTANYKITFPIFQKTSINDPLFSYLAHNMNPKLQGPLKWNFEKFLISPQGELVARFPSRTQPLSPKLLDAIESLLA